MRLIRAKIYRAIPELDAFADDQCRQFVRVANRSWRWQAVRLVVLGVLGLGVSVGAMAVGLGVLQKMFVRNAGAALEYAAAIAAACVVLGAGFVMLLAFRDWLLRRRVKKLIRERGKCFNCSYSLLGVPVEEDVWVTCPECGSRVQTDPAFSELATLEGGAKVYAPVVPREAVEVQARRRRRRRAFLKWSAIAAGSCVLLLASAYGLWWWSLVTQAERARASRDGLAKVRALMKSAQGPEFVAAGEANQWDAFLKIVNEAAESRRVYAGSVPEGWTAPVKPDVDFSMLLSVDVAEQYDKAQRTPGLYLASRAMTLEAMDKMRAAGVMDRAAGVLAIKIAMRELPETSVPLVDLRFEGLSEARAFARMSVARMQIALYTQDRVEYLAAMEQALVVSRIIERQGSLIDRLVSTAIDSLVFTRVREHLLDFRDEQWADGALRIMRERSGRLPASITYKFEEEGGLDAVRWFYSDPARVQRCMVMGSAGMEPPVFDIQPGWLGTLESNERSIKQLYGGLIQYFETPASARGPLPTVPAGTPALAQSLLPSLSRAIATDTQREQERQSLMLNLALETYRLRHGRYPESLTEIAGDVPSEVLIDRWTGKAMEYAVSADKEFPHMQSVLLGVDVELEKERKKREAGRLGTRVTPPQAAPQPAPAQPSSEQPSSAQPAPVPPAQPTPPAPVSAAPSSGG